MRQVRKMKAKNELRYYLTYVYLSIYGNTVLVFPFTSPYVGCLFVIKLGMFSCTGEGWGRLVQPVGTLVKKLLQRPGGG